MTTLINDIWAVQVPGTAKYFRVDCVPQADLYQIICYKDSKNEDFPDEIVDFKYIDIPSGQWEIVCTSKEATEDQAMAIVNIPLPTAFGRSAHDWLNDLLTSKGFDLNKNFLLLKSIA
jgi:hypothetical protein